MTVLRCLKFSVNLEGSVNYLIHEEAAPLTVEASAGETGNVTYQWYVNSVEANGGGTRIEQLRKHPTRRPQRQQENFSIMWWLPTQRKISLIWQPAAW